MVSNCVPMANWVIFLYFFGIVEIITKKLDDSLLGICCFVESLRKGFFKRHLLLSIIIRLEQVFNQNIALWV